MRVSLALVLLSYAIAKETISSVDSNKYSVAKEKRFLIYDINHGEGFNLRRDVYMRMANTVRLLRESGENFHLVLPPWGGLYHWGRQAVRLPWNRFFDLQSQNAFVPVMEFEQFLDEVSSPIENVIYLQHYKEGWGERYEHKFHRRECNDGNKFYKQQSDNLWKGWFFTFDDVRAKHFECISIQGDSSTLRDLVLQEFPDSQSLFIDRAETILHKDYGEKDYWAARRSMRYANHLLEIAARFRQSNFGSTDESDGTILPFSWKDESHQRRAKGGNYICAHWRRKDFVRAHGKEIPSIVGTAKILNRIADEQKVTKVFLATDASDHEVKELEKEMKCPVVRFSDQSLSDGEIAIIDQIICSRARFFTGSHLSTFSFRIQEDREILGFQLETTFNRMCPDGQNECEQPAKWKIVR